MSIREAEQLLNQHIGTWYCTLPRKSRCEKSNPDLCINFLETLSELKKAKFITFTTNEDSSKFTTIIEPTEIGKPISTELGKNQFGIIGGKRKVDKIIKISGETVFFSFWFTPSTVGQIMDINKGKFRGKAIISYDIFLDKFFFKGFLESPWEEEKWSKSRWTYTKDNKIYYSDKIKD